MAHTDMSISAMKQALEALEWNYGTDLENIENCTAWLDKLDATIPALRLAIEEAEDAVAAEREAVLEAVEALTGMEADRHKMFSEGYDHALYHIRQVVEGRSKK